MPEFHLDKENQMFQLAFQLINHSSRNIFLTGKAGTGKTTFLKYIRENCPKQTVVLAPTGVAAINAGGVTIHSFFQLPLSPFLPDQKGLSSNNAATTSRHGLISRLRFSTEKMRILEELELLIIDEISMVRCDVLDEIDLILSHFRQKPNQRFGGVQVLLIGDMLQLPPVIKEPEWRLLSDYYPSPYFFDSNVIRQEPPLYIEFTEIYRQSDGRFIQLLNQVRNNQLDEEGRSILESRFNPTFRRKKKDGYIILTTHNEKARETNFRELKEIQEQIFEYPAEIKDDFTDKAYPADELLQLKIGAQVMFIKNDGDLRKRYYNGKLGLVTSLDESRIRVQCNDGNPEIEVKKETWDNIRYTYNNSTRHLDEITLGSFTQFPLRLAWAITIHKSQGLTFDKAIIDAGEAFAPGQVYVALSRCTNLEGLVLQSRIKPSGLFIDEKIIQFSQSASPPHLLMQELAGSRLNYQENTLKSLFDFTKAGDAASNLFKYLEENPVFGSETNKWMEELIGKIDQLHRTSQRFQLQLQELFRNAAITGDFLPLRSRLEAAAAYFASALEPILQFIQQSPASTDGRNHAKEFNDSLKDIFSLLAITQYLMKAGDDRLDMEAFHHRKRKFTMPAFRINAYAGSNDQRTKSVRPILHQQLRILRDSICARKDTPIYMVAGSRTIDEMAEFLPLTLGELKMISGFGEARTASYGNQFLEVIRQYCEENNLQSLVHEKTSKKKNKENRISDTSTKAISYRLYKDGLAIGDIARQRGLTSQTIETHLTYYVQQGLIHIDELLSIEKRLIIEPLLKDYTGGPITDIKNGLDASIGFGDIRLVIAWIAYQKNERVV